MKDLNRVETWETHSPEETMDIGAEIVEKRVTQSGTFGLIGPLGSGKTTFVKGVIDACGGEASQVRSPTYALLQRYQELDPVVVHADLYRTEGPESQETIGLQEYFEKDLVLVEWAELWSYGWPDDTLTLTFEHIDRATRNVSLLETSPGQFQDMSCRSAGQ